MVHIYDYAIIGGGLSGLAIATALAHKTQNILLLDSGDFVGGANRAPLGAIQGSAPSHGLRLVPNTSEARDALLFLESLLGLKIIHGTTALHPQTYDSGEFKDFLGFGEQAPLFYDELKYFLSEEEILTSLGPSQWIALLQEKFLNLGGQIQNRSFVTKILAEGKFANNLMINGHKSIQAEKYIFCGNIKELGALLPPGTLNTRQRGKLNQSVFWNALCLDLVHSAPITEQRNLFLLDGTTSDEIGPCIGRFSMVADDKTQISQWLSFVDGESQEDDETTANALKKMKRQIKRAFPEAFQNLKLERIFLAPQMGGHGDLKLEADSSLPGLKNLFVGSGVVSGHPNLVGSLLQAQKLAQSIAGFDVALHSQAVVSPTPTLT